MGTAVAGSSSGWRAPRRSTSPAGSTGQPRHARDRAPHASARSSRASASVTSPRTRASSPTSRDSISRIRSCSCCSRAWSSRASLLASTTAIGSTKIVSPEPELSWTMPGTALRDDAFTASTGRPPRSVVNDSWRWERRRTASSRIRSAAVRRAAASRRRSGRELGGGGVEQAAARVERAGERGLHAPGGADVRPRDRLGQPRGDVGELPHRLAQLEPHAERREHREQLGRLEHRPADGERHVLADVARAARPRQPPVAQQERLLGLGAAGRHRLRVGRRRQGERQRPPAGEGGHAREPLAHRGQLQQLGAPRVHHAQRNARCGRGGRAADADNGAERPHPRKDRTMKRALCGVAAAVALVGGGRPGRLRRLRRCEGARSRR